jgi:hypothetical protein
MKVLELLDKKDKWIKGAYAVGSANVPVEVENPFAVAFCLLGGLKICYSRPDRYTKIAAVCKKIFDLYSGLLGVEDDDSPESVIIRFNDHPSVEYEDVVKVLKEAGI